MRKHWAWVSLILANLFWAGNYLFGKYVTAEMPAVWITLLRWVLALLVLVPIARWSEKADWRIVRQHGLPLLALGLLGVIGYNLFLYAALAHTSSLNAALVNSLNPALIVIASAFLLRERMNALQWGGFVLSLVGVMITLTRGELGLLAELQLNRGDLLMLLAITVWTGYSILARRLGHIPPFTLTAVSALFAVLLLLPFALLTPFDAASVSTLSWSGILYMAIFPSVGSYLLWNGGIRVTGANQAGFTLHLIPVFTALFGFLLGQSVTAAQLLGGLLVVAGVLGTSSAGRGMRKKASDRST